jgi:hypothetical protein
MIVKKIQPDYDKPVARSVRDLSNYINAASTAEKLLYSGSRNFLASSRAGQREEMAALAGEAVRSKNSINHYILSWKEGEIPSAEQVKSAVAIFVSELGTDSCQTIWGAHQNTDNVHVHVMINRVDPATLRVIKINKGFDLEAAHRAIARIESAQGWRREERGRYVVDEDNSLTRTTPIDDDTPRTPCGRARDFETRTGEMSAERIAQQVGWPLIQNAKTWRELHERLAVEDMRYERKGSGAIIFVGDDNQPVKASRVARKAALGALELRLGPYEPAPLEVAPGALPAPSSAPASPAVAKRGPRPISSDAADYITQRRNHYTAQASAKHALARRIEEERAALRAAQRAERDALFGKGWQGRGRARNLAMSVIASGHAARRAAMIESHRADRCRLATEYKRFPDLEEWLRTTKGIDAARRHRYRACTTLAEIHGGSEPDFPSIVVPPRDIRAYHGVMHNSSVHYVSKNGSTPAFIDYGLRIVVIDRSDDAVLAALQLAHQKYGKRIQLYGHDDYIRQAVRIAVANGISIANRDLREAVEQEQEKLRPAEAAPPAAPPVKPPPVKQRSATLSRPGM